MGNWIAISKRCLPALFCGAMATSLGGCGGGGGDFNASQFSPGIYRGQTAAVGNGVVQPFVTIGNDGLPSNYGATFTAGTLSGLPPEDFIWDMDFPPEAAATPMRFFSLHLSAHGHVPVGVFDRPHFDCHFYFISRAERDGISSSDNTIPRSDLIPLGYAPAPDGTADAEGWHWVLVSAPELNGVRTTRSLIYMFGFGRLISIEPLLMLEFLGSRPTITDPVVVPDKVSVPGYYPSRYTVATDATTGDFTVTFERLVLRGT